MKVKLFNVSLLAVIVFSASSQAANITAEKLYNQYKNKSDNKAFSIGINGVAGTAWGASTKEEAMNLAQDTCKSSGGLNCNVTEVNGRPLSNNDSQVKNFRTVNNYNIVSNGVNYKPDLSISSTGFFINKNYLLTTSNAVESCSKVNYKRNGRLIEATVIRTDKINNISILKSAIPNDTYAIISSKKRTSQGERTYTYGFEFSDMGNSKIPSYQGKITDGIVSRASGSYNDIRIMTITNEISRGDIGAPVMSENGDVIGIVTSDKKNSMKSSILSIFLNEQNVSYHMTDKKTADNKISPSDIADKSQKFSVPLVCLKEA
ncbi:trypsin-like peptidase domain-containing protein [Photobacterium sp.]|uniref:trypsin-like peptidase domain-containing protein n=1 Tax=Photobacterium sp. TaxID=660 RepID=UPI00299D868A|nr:trypsin-like peptidase domain-containing protein [Photobacterium sp.]MDX1303538.1 trypsin-like peptidase domain-containing protein [Photobacterium sp.]